MAYGLKYLCEYRSKMRDKLLYRIEIEERDATAASDDEALKMLPYDDVFTLKQGGADDAEYTAVKGGSVTLKLLCTHNMEYVPLFTTEPQKYRLTIYEFRNGIKTLFWRGFLAANSYKEDFARPPYVVTLSATDGFSLLSAMPFRDTLGAKRSGVVSVYDLLSATLENLHLDLPVCDWVNIGARPSQSLRSVCIDQESIYRAYTDPTWRDVLDMCTQTFCGQIFQAAGVFHVRRIASLREKARPEVATSQQPLVTAFWADKCDVSASSELSLLSPYKHVDVSLAKTAANGDEGCYNRAKWRSVAGPPGEFKVLKNRIYVAGLGRDTYFKVGNFAPTSKINISVAFDAFNATSAWMNIYCDVSYKCGTVVKYWDATNSVWVSGSGYVQVDRIDASEVGVMSYYYPLSLLQNKSKKISITSVPKLNDDMDGVLTLHLRGECFEMPPKFFVANIEVSTDLGNDATDITKTLMAINRNTSDKCTWTSPVRDGGYNANISSVTPVVLVDANGIPVVAWTAPTERGAIMDIVADDIRLLRSVVIRQIDGELRCPHAIDLNTVLFDNKFTNALYYVNSLELLASRQVYKVQLRELLDALQTNPYAQMIPIGACVNKELICALHGTLFFKVGTDSFGVDLYDVNTRKTMRLPYNDSVLVIRKGLNSVVIQVGISEVYAIDNVGAVLSHLNKSSVEVINYATALYDADRKAWVSYEATPQSKTHVVVFSDKMEEESNETFDIAASGLTLMSNGYLLSAQNTTYWHNYELHAPTFLPAVTDPVDPMSTVAFRTLAVSDALVVKRGMLGLGRLEVTGLYRRTGYKFRADECLHTFSDFLEGTTVSCNNAICAVKYVEDNTATVEVYDGIHGRAHTFTTHAKASVVVCGARVYVAVPNNALSVFSLDDYILS